MALSQLTEKTIRQYSSAQSFQRGSDYYQEGAVTSLGLTSPESITKVPTPVPLQQIEIDPKAIHRQIRSIIRSQSSKPYWDIDEVVSKLGGILEPAWTLIKAEDGRYALTLLRAITEGCVAEWKHLDDDDCQGSLFFSDLTSALAEAVFGYRVVVI